MIGRKARPPHECLPRLQVLGAFQLTCRGRTVVLGAMAQRLIAFIYLHPPAVDRQLVYGSLWPDSPEHRAKANLRQLLWTLRRDEHRLVLGTSQLRLAPGVVSDLDALWDSTTAELAESEPQLFDLLPGWYEDWVSPHRERVRLMLEGRIEAAALDCLGCGRFATAVVLAGAVCRAEPLRETSVRLLVEALVRQGNVADAKRAVDRYRASLLEDLGLAPSELLQSLITQHLTNPRPGPLEQST